jgi:hypothetical protein
MDLLFVACAIFGGTVLVAQFLLGFGAGHDHPDEAPDDIPDHIPDHVGPMDGDAHDAHDAAHHHGSTWVFGVLSFRTVMIGLTFFGLTGKAATASGFEQPWPLVVAIGCGLASMYAVFFLMRGLYRLTADGTERIGRSLGEEGTVYLTIPGQNSGAGKVHVPVQNRLVEYEAMTSGEKIPTGARIVVVGILGPDRVAVEPIREAVRNSNA